jgi:RinA family phage transcriptional activator
MTQFDRKLTPAEFKFVEHKLYNYPTNKQIVEDYERERENIILATPHREKAMPANLGVGKPIETAIILLGRLEQKVVTETFWIRAIEDVMSRLSDEDKQLVELKYFDAYLTNAGVARKLHISERDFYNRRSKLVHMFAKRFAII